MGPMARDEQKEAVTSASYFGYHIMLYRINCDNIEKRCIIFAIHIDLKLPSKYMF